MARKVRRVRRRSSNSDTTDSNESSGSKEEALRDEYAYVLRDLRQILILAAVMFLLLIMANLLI